MESGQNNARWWQKMDPAVVDLDTLRKHFELYNRTEGKSPKTVDWYNQTLRRFERFRLNQEKSTRIADIGETEVREFILYLQSRQRWQENPYLKHPQGNLAAITVQTYVRALRAFFNWCFKEGYTNENRLAKVKPPKAPTNVTSVLTGAEIQSILKSIDWQTAVGARNYTLMVLFLDTGLRCSELRNLLIQNINLEGGYLKVMGKGGKERVLPFGTTAQKALLRYLRHFRSQPANFAIDNVFLTSDGRVLSKNCMKGIFQGIACKSGVKRLHPHLCRHTFATNYLVNGGDVFTLQQILGHTTLEMVRHYVSLASSQVTIQHRKFSPMDRLTLVKSEASLSDNYTEYAEQGPQFGKEKLDRRRRSF